MDDNKQEELEPDANPSYKQGGSAEVIYDDPQA